MEKNNSNAVYGFYWGGMEWETIVPCHGEQVEVCIRCEKNQVEVVEELGEVAKQYELFIDNNQKKIITAIKKQFSDWDTTRMTSDSFLTISGWTVSGTKPICFELGVQFHDSVGEVFDGLTVIVNGFVNNKLNRISDLQFDLESLR